MSVEQIMLKHMGKIKCDICLSSIQGDVVGVSCCHTLFHASCLDANRKHSQVCPICEEMYTTNNINPLLHKLTYDNICSTYAEIYRDQATVLGNIDKSIRKQLSNNTYYERFKGYYPYNMFADINIHDQWDTFSYGILRNYDWKYTVACGHSIWNMAKKSKPESESESESIYLIIYNRDYRKVREQLQHLMHTVESLFQPQDIYIYIQDGILVINIRGMVRKICVYIEYNDDLYWIVYSPRKYFNTYGTLYHPDKNQLFMTVKAIVNNKPPKYPILSSLSYVMGYNETKQNYVNRIGCGMEDSNFLLQNIYPDYRCKIFEKKGIDNLKKTVISRIIKDLSCMVDIDHVVDFNATDDISMKLVTQAGSVNIPMSIISSKNIKKQISRLIYQQPLHLYPKCTFRTTEDAGSQTVDPA